MAKPSPMKKYGTMIQIISLWIRFCNHQKIRKITAGKVQVTVFPKRAQTKKSNEIP
jgi:hypothetical protein